MDVRKHVRVSAASSETCDGPQLPSWLIAPFVLGATLALAGGFWDDAWHTERGRDSFFIAPHFAIYSGVSLAGAALAGWALTIIRRRGLAAVLADGPLVLALVSVAVTLASAPVDNFWHVAFGRDAVIWSPPHVLGIVGTAGLAVAMLVELGRSPARWAGPLRSVTGALLLAALSFLVVEYDTDVPQFPVVWYLPVLALASSFALSLIRLATRERYAATRAAAAHLGYFGLVALFLALEGFDTPKAPLILAAAVVLDVTAQRRWPIALQAAAFVAALYGAYAPSLDLLGHGVRLGFGDVALGLPASFAAVLVVLAVIERPRLKLPLARRIAATTALVLALMLALAAPALAHDPGQGKAAGSFDFSARLVGQQLTVAARRNGSDCDRLAPWQLVGRRAGRVTDGALTRKGCEFRGRVKLPGEGRWFVYLDVRDVRERDRTVESWIPVKVDEGQSRFAAAGRYAYVVDRKPATVAKWVIGTVMYGLVIAFLVAIVSVVRRRTVAPRPAGSG